MLDLGRTFRADHLGHPARQNARDPRPARLGIVGSYSRDEVDPSGRHDLTLSLKGSRWPWTLANALVQTRGELTGKLDGEMRTGRVQIAGDATVTNLVAIGDLLSSDTVHLETVTRPVERCAEYNGRMVDRQARADEPRGIDHW